jgi:hypothetical protein
VRVLLPQDVQEVGRTEGLPRDTRRVSRACFYLREIVEVPRVDPDGVEVASPARDDVQVAPRRVESSG